MAISEEVQANSLVIQSKFLGVLDGLGASFRAISSAISELVWRFQSKLYGVLCSL